MDLKELIDKRIDDKLGGSQGIQRVPAKVLSVTEGYKRADVKLANGAIIKDMLNKTGEELDIGQGVYVEYMTLPSSGYIAMTTGECRPLGGGGGAPTAEVENAAVITTNPEDYMVVEELMLDISPETMLYYGNMPAFTIVQGHYCLMSNSSNPVSYTNNHWIIGGIDGLYERIIVNKAKFGSQIGNSTRGGILYGSNTSVAYPDRYIYQLINIYSITGSTSGYQYQCRLNQYYATVTAPSGNWWESAMTWGSFTLQYYTVNLKAYDNTNYLGILSDIFIVPVVSTFTNAPNVGSIQTPFGYAYISGYLIFASSDGEHYGVVYQAVSSGNTVLIRTPLLSDAENCFTLGISQRTEPVYPNNGGGA